MISNRLSYFLQDKMESTFIPAEKVAHVQLGNNLEHALLVLTKCGYSIIPVLDFDSKLHGLISAAMITEKILGLEHIEYEKLETLKVEEAMKSTIPTVQDKKDIEKIVRLLIDHLFVCIVDGENHFQGIITRRIILKQINQLIHFPVEENQ